MPRQRAVKQGNTELAKGAYLAYHDTTMPIHIFTGIMVYQHKGMFV